MNGVTVAVDGDERTENAVTVPVGVETELEDTENPGEQAPDASAQPGPATPWSRNDRDAQPRLGTPSPGAANGGAPQPTQGQSAPNATAAPPTSPPPTPPPGGTSATQPPPTAPSAVPPPHAVAPTPAPAPAPASPPAATSPPPEPPPGPLDPEMLSALAPVAVSAGAMALGMLPMIASALSGLGSGGGGTGGSTGDAGGTGGAETGGLTPESQKALEVLDLLEKVYGEGEATDPQVKQLREELGVSPDNTGGKSGKQAASVGKGKTPGAIKAQQLYQANARTAFNNLDNDLAREVTKLAGKNKIDKKAVASLLREVNVALAEIGTAAYTKAGQQKVHRLLSAALRKAQAIVSGGQANSAETARAIKQLTYQYLYNLRGQKFEPSTGTGGSTGSTGTSRAADLAMRVALSKLGVPYVWGAEGPNSFDCSGLMQYAAAKAGVRIPRVADDQFDQLPQVNPADIRPGDLIFPASSYKNGEFGHVMMYIGNNRCVESPYTGANVRITSLPNGYRATRWS